MYNEAYIQTFDESIYINLLNDNGQLENIAKNYLTRYEKGVDVNMLALKDSLDHYIAKKISTDKNFIDSQEFKNYAKYLKKIVSQKSYTIYTNYKIYLELSTNVVFDYLTGDKLNKVFPKNNIETIRNNNQKIIRAIFQKIRGNKQISAGELGFISDYLDNKKDIESETYKEYMEYIFKNNNNIIGTPKILSAILTYMPGFYDKRYACGVKNARAYLAHTDGKDKDGDDIPILIAHSSGAYI